MPETWWSAALAGGLFGALNGWLSRAALKRVLNSADSVFLAVFSAGILYRLLFLAASVWLLRYQKYIIIIPFAVALIAVQVVFEIFPLKKHGSERNT